MNAKLVLVGCGLALLSLCGCTQGAASGRGLQLPKGSAEKGKAAFVALNCIDCHVVDGVTLPQSANPPLVAVRLGGEVTRLRTYGELVTAIIYPEHRSTLPIPAEMSLPGGKSPMRDMTADMTVAQLIDLVSFLETRYRRAEPQYVAGLP